MPTQELRTKMGDSVVTPIDRALARVRWLRQIEGLMSRAPWKKNKYGGYGGGPTGLAPFVIEAEAFRVDEDLRRPFDSDGTVALRNAAPALLALLEALLTLQQAEDAVAECKSTRSILSGPIQNLDCRREAVRDALAAFVEGKDVA